MTGGSALASWASDAARRRYKDDSDVPLAVVAALAAETEIPIEWIATGRAMDRGATLPNLDERGDALDLSVRKLLFKIDGNGDLVLDGNAPRVRMPRHILQQAGVAPDYARLWQASGDSMRETISDGDLLLIDISPGAIQLAEGKIYLFSLGDEPHVKRLKKSVDRLIIVSDNREMFPAEPVPPHVQLKIHGRVKWSGRCH